MRRFTTRSIVMLLGAAGVVGAAACGSVLGIDTNKELESADAGGSSSSGANVGDASSGSSGSTSSSGASGSSGSVSSSSSGSTHSDGGVVITAGVGVTNPQCGSCDSVAGWMCNRTTGFCEKNCASGAASCAAEQFCPAGADCLIHCKGDGCKQVTCEGPGTSCTLECLSGGADCKSTTCSASVCVFQCKANSCAPYPGDPVSYATCGSQSGRCALVCGDGKACDLGISCCATDCSQAMNSPCR